MRYCLQSILQSHLICCGRIIMLLLHESEDGDSLLINEQTTRIPDFSPR